MQLPHPARPCLDHRPPDALDPDRRWTRIEDPLEALGRTSEEYLVPLFDPELLGERRSRVPRTHRPPGTLGEAIDQLLPHRMATPTPKNQPSASSAQPPFTSSCASSFMRKVSPPSPKLTSPVSAKNPAQPA